MRAELCAMLVHYLQDRLAGNGIAPQGRALSWASDVLGSRYLGTAVALQVVSLWRDTAAVLYIKYCGCACVHMNGGRLCGSPGDHRECCPQHCSLSRCTQDDGVHEKGCKAGDISSTCLCSVLFFLAAPAIQCTEYARCYGADGVTEAYVCDRVGGDVYARRVYRFLPDGLEQSAARHGCDQCGVVLWSMLWCDMPVPPSFDTRGGCATQRAALHNAVVPVCRCCCARQL